MEDRKEKNGAWVSVPQFGEWEQKGQVPDYSLDFSKIREMKKQKNKREVSRASIGNEEEFINPTVSVTTAPTTDDHHSPTTKRGLFSYFNCCIKA